MLTIVPQASDNERIRSIIRDCYNKHMPFSDAVEVLANAGFGAKEIIEFQAWSKANPAPDAADKPRHEHRSPREIHEQATPFKEY